MGINFGTYQLRIALSLFYIFIPTWYFVLDPFLNFHFSLVLASISVKADFLLLLDRYIFIQVVLRSIEP